MNSLFVFMSVFQDTRRKYIGHVNCSNPSIFTFKTVMSESNLYKLKGVFGFDDI